MSPTSREGKVYILWNQEVHIDTTKPNSKSDIIIHDNKKETFVLIDFAISGHRNVIKNVVENIINCKDLVIKV